MRRSWRLRCRVCRHLKIARNPEPILPERTAFGRRISGNRRYSIPLRSTPQSPERIISISTTFPMDALRQPDPERSHCLVTPVGNILPEPNSDRSPEQSSPLRFGWGPRLCLMKPHPTAISLSILRGQQALSLDRLDQTCELVRIVGYKQPRSCSRRDPASGA
jgi:hypothetical protein